MIPTKTTCLFVGLTGMLYKNCSLFLLDLIINCSCGRTSINGTLHCSSHTVFLLLPTSNNLFWKLQLALQQQKPLFRLDFKGLLSGLRQFLTTESPLKMMKNAFYFMLKAFFVLKIFTFLYWYFRPAEKQ